VTHDDVFLQSIIDSPEDDFPRLVYADWLEDQGRSERAEFIRVQVELAPLPEHDPRRAGLAYRERELLRSHGEAWAGAVVGLAEDWEYRRGFIEAVTVSARFFVPRAEALFRAAPVREVRLEGGLDDSDRLASCTCLGRLITLDLSAVWLRDHGLGELLSSPHLVRLRKLGLDRVMTGGPVLEHLLARSDHLPELVALDLGWNHLRAEDVGALAASPLAGRLRALALGNSNFEDAGVEALVTGGLRELHTLSLPWNGIGPQGVAALVRSPFWGSLVDLDLSFNPLQDAGARELLDAPRPAGLASLNLGETQIGGPFRRQLRDRFGPSVCRLELV
jgi:uncharacterized protein (TIGR02996 family)